MTIQGGERNLKRIALVSALAVILVSLMSGTALAFEEWHQGPWTTAQISFSMPFSIGEYVPDWVTPPASVFYITDLTLTQEFVSPNELVTFYYFAGINGKVNFNTGRVNVICNDVTINFYHPAMEAWGTQGSADWTVDGFYGRFVLNAYGVYDMQNLDNVVLKGTMWLDGYELFEASRIKASVSLYGGMLYVKGTAWIPVGQEPLWAAVFGI